MILALCWILIYITDASGQQQGSSDTGGLFLTPYVEECDYYGARQKSKIDLSTLQSSVTAHSGYITVKGNGTWSNLFFVFTEVEGNSSTAPLLLWTQGGPGLSALFGLLLENGPIGFTLNASMSPILYQRTNTLQKNMSVIYLDLPVGAGFSFTNDSAAYPTKLEDVVDQVMQFLNQFLEVFSEYKQRDFYLAGESYGARYSVAVAQSFLQNMTQVPLQLKGLIGGNGFLGPILTTAESSEFLYQASMVTEEGRNTFAQQFKTIEHLLQSGNYTATLGLLFQTIFTDFTKVKPTLFQNLTLYNDHASPLYTERPLLMLACFKFLNDSLELRQLMHAGSKAIFQYNNPYLLNTFAPDWLRDITNITQDVLSNISVMLYYGQLDALFPSVKQRAYLATLKWTYATEYKNAQRSTWKPYNGYYGNAGYIKQTTKFVEAVLLGMSHYGAVEKPDEVYYLMTQFVGNQTKTLQQKAA